MRPVLFACLAAALCGCSAARAGPPGDPLTRGEWRLQDLNARGVVAESVVTVRFGADGRASGRGGCNRWSGAWRREKAALTLTELASTRTACAAALTRQEIAFLSALQEASGYRIAGDGGLLVTTRDGRRLTFRPAAD